MHKPIIRPIHKQDNPKIAQVIRTVLLEMGVPKVGTAYEDVALDQMYENYDQTNKNYFVVEEAGMIIGGAGIAALEKGNPTICELQKMYFLPEARGRGIGSQMMHRCLAFAKASGFEHCYLETLPYMEAARTLYKKVGFEPLDNPLGNTGHYSCTLWMLRKL